MPVDQVILFQYNHLTAQMEFVAEWNSDAQARLPTRIVPIQADTGYVRTLSKTPGLHEATACPLISQTTGRLGGECFCLPLVHDSILVGLLRLRCLAGRQLSPAQMQFLNALSPQVALALALSIAFPRQLTEAQRTERRRVAYELHDSLAQQIGYLHLSLDRLAEDERLENATWLRTELDRLREVANESYLEVRNNLALLHNESATDLNQTIADYVRSISPQVPFKIEFETSGTPSSLEPLSRQHVMGLIQESLNNIRKHAQACHVRLALLWRVDGLDVTVVDDGIGFDPDSTQTNGHYGLTMLRERIQELRGDMQIKTAPGAGTSLRFEIPLRAS
jgi:two-component system nitrate/nitrite sensor histidine kinase NarX